jgi:RNA polymerase sigma-70 factor (ECF subfamily)
MRDLVAKMLARVDPETQAMAIHYHVDEMTLEEVAELLGRSVPTVRKRLQEFAAVCGKEFPS